MIQLIWLLHIVVTPPEMSGFKHVFTVLKKDRGKTPLAIWGPHIQFHILALVSQCSISPTSLLLPTCPPSFPALRTSQDPQAQQNVNWASNLLFHLLLSVMITKNQCQNNGNRSVWFILYTIFLILGLVHFTGLIWDPNLLSGSSNSYKYLFFFFIFQGFDPTRQKLIEHKTQLRLIGKVFCR